MTDTREPDEVPVWCRDERHDPDNPCRYDLCGECQRDCERPTLDPFGFADAIQVDHLTNEQVDQVAAILDKADEASP